MPDVILKYTILPMERQEIRTPPVRRMLGTAFQGDDLVLWAQCTDMTPSETHKIAVIVTGSQTVPENASHIGTTINPDGFVMHVFEVF